MPNQLLNANSLYLRKHGDNPIDWWPWGEAALTKAKQENKPIFLSIGYSSCHWCTVMEGEAFSDEAIAQYMNANFVAIKVDREERPDIDSIYMQAVQMLVGHGGWPLNVFLTPDELVPFYGGTYFPMEPNYGRPGFLQVLQSLRRFYDTDQEKLQAVQGKIMQRLQQGGTLAANSVVDPAVVVSGIEQSAKLLLSQEAGPRFPMIPHADLALRGTRFPTNQAMEFAPAIASRQRGLDLALGGIFDHVAGGFHRYSVNPNWSVPHFEKMLYDNGQIMEYLANLWSAGKQEPAFERAIAQTVTWLKREMIAPAGYFYAAQDADNFVTAADAEPEEGAFYVWDYEELLQLLSAEALTELQEHFTITSGGNFEGQNVLQRIAPERLSPTVESILAQLYHQRYGQPPAPSLDAVTAMPPARTNQEAKSRQWTGRIPPVTDTKMIVAWNSLMISGLARAAIAFQQSDYLDMAIQAVIFILGNQQVGGRFHRLNYEGTVSVKAQSEDYAFFIKALLDIDQAMVGPNAPPLIQGKPALEWAIALQTEFDQWLWSEEQGGYYNTARDVSDDLIVRERSYSDNTTPSANGVAIANLVRLFLHTDNTDYLDQAEQALNAFSGAIAQTPQAVPSLLAAMDWLQHPTSVKFSTDPFATNPTSSESAVLEQQALLQTYHPTTVFKPTTDLPEAAVGLVCRGLSCGEPALSWAQLREQLS
ncbi:MAG: thioredoxin domain-containing protein [Leptolyngbyaceae cyanobacterium]